MLSKTEQELLHHLNELLSDRINRYIERYSKDELEAHTHYLFLKKSMLLTGLTSFIATFVPEENWNNEIDNITESMKNIMGFLTTKGANDEVK